MGPNQSNLNIPTTSASWMETASRSTGIATTSLKLGVKKNSTVHLDANAKTVLTYLVAPAPCMEQPSSSESETDSRDDN